MAGWTVCTRAEGLAKKVILAIIRDVQYSSNTYLVFVPSWKMYLRLVGLTTIVGGSRISISVYSGSKPQPDIYLVLVIRLV